MTPEEQAERERLIEKIERQRLIKKIEAKRAAEQDTLYSAYKDLRRVSS